jgi:CheY-like chemotaxis protein
MDVQMREMDGFAATAATRERGRETRLGGAAALLAQLEPELERGAAVEAIAAGTPA